MVKSLTNDQKKQVQGPIEWTRIHNLPDHVYFNHAQHVTVGKLQCQTCHGKVETMEVLAQASPLSMGWCINCHRQTEVKFKDNPYYADYTRYHEELASGKREKVTVADIGGLECQKCHY
ncbi:MAG: cytochrome c3 family protein [Saprospiraceae bacterium]|nr:cytochrome c3 family protein [Saprospiraceae bacterium]